MLSGRENRDLNIIIFREVLENFARVDRVLTKPGGSLLLAGRSGVGRRTAVTLVSSMHQMQLFTPKISRTYGLKQFKNDLKIVSKNCIRTGNCSPLLLLIIFISMSNIRFLITNAFIYKHFIKQYKAQYNVPEYQIKVNIFLKGNTNLYIDIKKCDHKHK